MVISDGFISGKLLVIGFLILCTIWFLLRNWVVRRREEFIMEKRNAKISDMPVASATNTNEIQTTNKFDLIEDDSNFNLQDKLKMQSQEQLEKQKLQKEAKKLAKNMDKLSH